MLDLYLFSLFFSIPHLHPSYKNKERVNRKVALMNYEIIKEKDNFGLQISFGIL